MALSFFDLDKKTRDLMLEELRYDLERKAVFISNRLNDWGIIQYPKIIECSFIDGNDTIFASKLQAGCLHTTEQRKKPSGGFISVKVPANAHEMLAEGEFNRYYIRALCCRAIEENLLLKIYRAKAVINPRPESQRMLGQLVDPTSLLNDLRTNIGTDTSSGFPGPNSGLSVQLLNKHLE